MGGVPYSQKILQKEDFSFSRVDKYGIQDINIIGNLNKQKFYELLFSSNGNNFHLMNQWEIFNPNFAPIDFKPQFWCQ